MKKLSRKHYQDVRAWMYRNARPLELAKWKFYFEKGSKNDILDVLAFYQNEDGGFGHGLEPDCWNPKSVQGNEFVRIIFEINYDNPKHPTIINFLRYLETGEYYTGKEDPPGHNNPNAGDYPHAPWMGYDPETAVVNPNPLPHFNYICFILRYAERDSELYRNSLKLNDENIDFWYNKEKGDDIFAAGWFCDYLDWLEKIGFKDRYDWNRLVSRCNDLVTISIERDVNKWSEWCMKPSEYVLSPHDAFYPGNEEIISSELDYIINEIKNYNFLHVGDSYFKDERYKANGVITEHWWTGYNFTKNIRLLKMFDRIV